MYDTSSHTGVGWGWIAVLNKYQAIAQPHAHIQGHIYVWKPSVISSLESRAHVNDLKYLDSSSLAAALYDMVA